MIPIPHTYPHSGRGKVLLLFLPANAAQILGYESSFVHVKVGFTHTAACGNLQCRENSFINSGFIFRASACDPRPDKLVSSLAL